MYFSLDQSAMWAFTKASVAGFFVPECLPAKTGNTSERMLSETSLIGQQMCLQGSGLKFDSGSLSFHAICSSYSTQDGLGVHGQS